MRIFKELNVQAGITIMLVTHEPDIAAHAKRIVTFRDGHIVGDGPSTSPSTHFVRSGYARDDKEAVA